jgi:hypothetical protein
MFINGNTAIFNSTPDNYDKEKSGKKCNTVRKLTSIEEDGYSWYDVRECAFVQIFNKETGDSFRRRITDVTPIGDPVFLYIDISW